MKFPLLDLMGNLLVWLEYVYSDSVECTMEQIMFERGSTACAGLESVGLIVTSGVGCFLMT